MEQFINPIITPNPENKPKSKKKVIIIIVIVFVCLVLAVAGFSTKKNQINNQAVQQPAQTSPAWINVNKNNLPPNMITGVLFSKTGVILDRYYIDNTGALHGEYAFNLKLNSIHNENYIYSNNLTSLKYNKSITIQSAIPSLIVITKPNYSARIAFINPTEQNVEIDINYVYLFQLTH
jgi:hypothetical protein